jgi:methyl-accepting chemotaxis protein
MDQIRGVVSAMIGEEEQLLKVRTAAIDDIVHGFARYLVGGCLLAFVVVMFVVTIIVRTLNTRIGRAAQRMRDASRELHTAATQQARGAEEQVSASMQVNTTIRELSVTAKQIAESAHQVTDVATRTSDSTRTGDSKVQSAREAIEATREQVDEVVAHMLGLGRKSQEIGGIVDIVGELAEQTNILAINATIEAIGAGDAGRRFRVVADEIRKLADRVGASARSIRVLIEEVRAAANTTVMATEDGAKAVAASTQRFVDVGTSFAQIREYVGSTAAAAREIEMSTRQQTTAMEQVSHAMGGVSDTAREVATSAEQTLRTATELASVAEGLLRLVERDEALQKVALAAG